MDLELNADQELFRDTTRKFLEAQIPIQRVRALIDDPIGMDRDLWRQGGELGWFSMLVAEQHGGGSISGDGVRDLAIIVEELGRALLPGPVAATNVVAAALVEHGSSALRERYLLDLVGGATMATWAFAEANDRWDSEGITLEAAPVQGGFQLTGVKSPVEWAAAADCLLVTARTGDGLTQFLVPAGTAGVSLAPLVSLDLTRRFAQVRFDGADVPAEAVVGAVDGAEEVVGCQLELALALQCAETVGALDRLFEITLQYVKDRKAFGRPIGSFQALKHRLADMLLWLETSKAAAVAAVEAVQFASDAAEVVSVAKSYIGDRGPAIVRDCLQLHGGIGYTWEHDLHLYLRRVESNAALYGGPDRHRDRLADLIGL